MRKNGIEYALNKILSVGTVEREGLLRRYQLFMCVGCERGAYAEVERSTSCDYWYQATTIAVFVPSEHVTADVPGDVPESIVSELREAELCAAGGAYRAAGALLRSVLEKTLKANGYAAGKLDKKIEAAATDGVITRSRKRSAHNNIRLLGNDILHGVYRIVNEEQFLAAHRYTQRILEDLYDNREATLETLQDAGRKPVETVPISESPN